MSEGEFSRSFLHALVCNFCHVAKQELDADMISKSLDMEVVRYSKVWEDSRVLAEGLDINKDDVVLCITR